MLKLSTILNIREFSFSGAISVHNEVLLPKFRRRRSSLRYQHQGLLQSHTYLDARSEEAHRAV